MKVQEYFKKGQEVWVITGQGIKKAVYWRLENINGRFRWVYLGEIENYKDDYGNTKSCDEFPESKVFTSREAAVEFLRTGKTEDLKAVKTHESLFNPGEVGYRIGRGGVESERFESVRWRIGQFEYHTNGGGAAVYPERGRWFRTREEAVEALLAM